METKQKIDSFLKQSLSDIDNFQTIVPQNIENKIFQKFRDSNKNQQVPQRSFQFLQRIAVMLVLFLGGTLTGWWLRNPHNSASKPVLVKQNKSINPTVPENHTLADQIQSQPLKTVTPVKSQVKVYVKMIKQSAKLSKIKGENNPNQPFVNQYDLPSITELTDLGYGKLRFPSESIEFAKAENQRNQGTIQTFKFVSL